MLIRPVQPQWLSLAERLAGYTLMEAEASEAMAWDPIGPLSHDRLEQVLEIVGQILGFVE